MFRCPVCQPPFMQPEHQPFIPYAASSFSSTRKPTMGVGDDFINRVSSGAGDCSSSTRSTSDSSTTTRRTSNIRASPFFSTPPSSPSDMKTKVEDEASMSGHKRQSWNSTAHKTNVNTAATGARAPAAAGASAFSSHNAARKPTSNADLHSGNMTFDHSSLLEVISSLQEENRRLSGLLLQVMKEKEELVSRHEEESFRMVDDFEREKEELNKSFKGPTMKNKTKTTKEGTSDKSLSVTLLCIEGPHLGESVEVKGTLVIGSAPSDSTKVTSSNVYSLCRDNLASKNHAKLVLNKSGSKSKHVLMVKVYDLMSNHGTKVNNKVIPKGSSRQAFIKDKIQIGQSIFRITKTI